MRYIIEFEDKPIMEEDGLKFYLCVQAPWWWVSERIISRLSKAPKEIIHCHNCKWYGKIDNRFYRKDTCLNPNVQMKGTEESFCSEGRRREDGENIR